MILVLQQLCAALLVGLGPSALVGRLPRHVEWRRHRARRDPAAGRRNALTAGLVIIAQPWSAALGARRREPALAGGGALVYAKVASRLLQADALRTGLLLVLHAGAVGLVWRRACRRTPRERSGSPSLPRRLGAVDRDGGAAAHLARHRVARRRTASLRHSGGATRALAPSAAARRAAPMRILPPGPRLHGQPVDAVRDLERRRLPSGQAGAYEHLVDTRRQTLDPRCSTSSRCATRPVGAQAAAGAFGRTTRSQEASCTGTQRALPPAPGSRGAGGNTAGHMQAYSCSIRRLRSRSRGTARKRSRNRHPTPRRAAPHGSTAFAANVRARGGRRQRAGAPPLGRGVHPVGGRASTARRARVAGRLRAARGTGAGGASRVELEFVDPALRRGFTVSLVALCAALGLPIRISHRMARRCDRRDPVVSC